VHVTICARTEADVARAAREIGDATDRPVGYVACDITTPQGRAAVLAACPDPDILVTNAGGPPRGDFREWDRDTWIRALDANMLTPIELIKATVDGMIARRFGRIVNITSSAVKAPIDVLGLSNGARTGSRASSPGSRARSRRTASRSTTCCPAPSRRTGCAPACAFRADGIGRGHRDRASHDGGRRARPAASARPEEFGAACAFLCSAHAGYIVGQNILLDGGAYPDLLMIDLYYWTTPNGHKITDLPRGNGAAVQADPGQHRQGRPVQARTSSRCRRTTAFPGIVDRAPADGGAPLSMFESGAILLYLADKVGRLIPRDLRARLDCIQWLFWQMAGLGPMNGQTHHFLHSAPEQVPYAIDRYHRESGRLYAVLDKRLADREYIAGEYSIADIACYPWINPERQRQDIALFPNLARWRNAIAVRPAVEKAYALAKTVNPNAGGVMSGRGAQAAVRAGPHDGALRQRDRLRVRPGHPSGRGGRARPPRSGHRRGGR
jgi:GST-like protein